MILFPLILGNKERYFLKKILSYNAIDKTKIFNSEIVTEVYVWQKMTRF